MRLADMHIHTTFSPDGKSSMEEQCIKAIEIGIPIICFTDHVDFNSSEINVGRIINKASTNFDVSEYFLIPQNSKRRSESKEGMNPSITTSKSKAEFTSVNSEMTGNENQIINYCTNSAAFDGAVANRHIILLH